VAVALNDFLCFPKALCVLDALHGMEMAADDSLRCLHHHLEGLAVNAAREVVLDVKLLSSDSNDAFGQFFTPESACLDQLRSSLMNTPRNLKEETFSTSAPLMCKGA